MKNKNRYMNIVVWKFLYQARKSQRIKYTLITSMAFSNAEATSVARNDFWRMIWQQRVAAIVMITNPVERGRASRKCDMYWPKERVETHGVIQVKLVNEEARATYTIRIFSVKHLKVFIVLANFMVLGQQQTKTYSIKQLKKNSGISAAYFELSGPIIVRCSAGVGCTGTYTVLDAMVKQVECKTEINIRGFLCHIRN
ncbi:hypothetical protein DAPPUDRAFT_110592 [Daphnia pulex]|uniref:Tyrosine-protein phosphatase domain-containing protein n=1 Tax=Daphnia pulex TaxID=6669 RepID=E9H6Q1_DAPPU|nr:hypothetical protein DAPPUDRAFT_110592 [Daphnia pulex]|eukprot:EFX72598.1 hypothetical protein DAPPUDRAFT_110592 [Daphnia pulex]